MCFGWVTSRGRRRACQGEQCGVVSLESVVESVGGFREGYWKQILLELRRTSMIAVCGKAPDRGGEAGFRGSSSLVGRMLF